MLRAGFFFLLLACSLLIWACNADTFAGNDGSPPDATSDVVIGGDGGKGDGGPSEAGCLGPNFCKLLDSGASFCADFDVVGGDAGANWNNPPITTGGYTLGLIGDTFTSCPRALNFVVPPPDGGTNPGSAWLSQDLTIANLTDGGITLPHWIIDLDLWPPQTSGGQTFMLAHIREPAFNSSADKIGIGFSQGQWHLLAGPQTAPIALQEKQWSHITLEVQYQATFVYYVSLTINGNLEATLNVQGGQPTAPNFQLLVGVETPTVAPAGSIHYDNVVARLLP